MRFCPAIFMLADKEDKEAHYLLLDLYLNTAEGINMKITDGYVDCVCLESLISRLPPDRGVVLHRCLQHTWTNLKCEGKDKVRRPGGLDRRNSIDIADKCILGSTWFPSDVEFHTFWSSYLQRCASKDHKTDFNEPIFGKYLAKNILEIENGLIRAPWVCGLGTVRFGFTTRVRVNASIAQVNHYLRPGMSDATLQS